MSEADPKSPGRWTRRPSFSPSQLLTAQQLNLLVDNQRALSGKLMRSLHGHGVILGYAVSLSGRGRRLAPRQPDEEKLGGTPGVEISCGMALDRHGRLLHWPGGTLLYGEIANRNDCPGQFTLSVHHAERRVPTAGCGPCGDQPEWIEEGVVFTLTEDCRPADRACPEPKACVGLDDYVCFRTGGAPGAIPPASDLEWACDPPGALCRIACSDTYYDPGAGIPIACVTVADIAVPGCPTHLGFKRVGECCEVRPRVYRTPLLYELIHGCQHHLARVESLSWQDWLIDDRKQGWDYSAPWNDFAELFSSDKLLINFTRPIRVGTVHPGSVFLTAVYWEPGADYLLTRRIPARPVPVPQNAEVTTKFRLVIDPDWLASEIDTRSTLREGGRIELTIRGQMLRDECRNMLDAAPLFYEPASPPLSSPGGDFVAVFAFDRAPAQQRREPAAARRRPAPKTRQF